MSWFKRLLGLERKPRGLVMTVEIETLAPKPPRRPKPPRPPAEPKTDRPCPVAAAFPPPDGAYRFLALDVETANEDVATICQIGIATVSQSGEVRGYSTLVNPRCRFVFTDLHGIDARMVRDAPSFAEVFPAVLPLLSRHAIFQHSSFDRRAINAAHAALGLAAPDLRWHDSVRVARSAWPEFLGAGGHGLAHLKQALRLDFQHHDAGEDARAAAQVVLLAEQRLGQPFDQLVTLRTPRAKPVARPAAPEPAPKAAPAPPAQVCVFTGALSLPREDAAARAVAAGMTVMTNVTRKTTLVVVGEQDLAQLAGHVKSTRHRRAEELIAAGQPIRIIAETEFLTLVGAG